jgi:hypothetical protein
MRRHNKKGNGFYKIAETIPKYVSIDAALVEVVQDYLRKIAALSANGASGSNIPSSTEGTPASPPTGTSAEPKTQTAPPPTAAEPSTLYKSEEAQSARGETPATGTLPSGQPVGQPPGSVSQGTTSQPAGVSPAPGGAVPAQSGTTGTEGKTDATLGTEKKTDVTSGTEGKTDVAEAPSRKEPPNYLKNLALLIGVPLTIASLAGGAIRGFNMSNLIGLGLGTVATIYGFGFLDSILHPKVMLYEEIESLKRKEIFNFFSNPKNSELMVSSIYNRSDIRLKDLPPDYSTGSTPPEEFRTLYRAASGYVMDIYHRIPKESRPNLYYIFGYSTTGAPPQIDMLNSLERGSDLERHATIILLADLLKRAEKRAGNIQDAVDLLQRLVAETPYYWWPRSTRAYLADPIVFENVLGQVVIEEDLPEEIRKYINSLREKPLSQYFSEAAKNLLDGEQKAQPQ